MAAAHAVGFTVLQRLHVRAVAAAIRPRAVSGKISGDEDRLARIRDEPIHFFHIGRKRAGFAGGEVVEDGAQILRELLTVLDGKEREQRA